MLKLEKGLEGIYIVVREREKFFSSLFLKALAVALLFHIIFFVVFQIQPFKMTSTFLFPPVKVQTEKSGSALVQSEHDDDIALLPPPPYAIIMGKQLPQVIENAPKNIPIPTFYSDDQILLAFAPQMVEKPQVQLIISGELSTLNWILPEFLQQKIEVPINQDPLFVKYRIVLDENLREIFWFEKIQSSGSTLVDQSTEQLLLDLHFEGQSPFNPSGVIDFIIYQGRNS